LTEPLFELAPRLLPDGPVEWRLAERRDVAWLLREQHYLGPLSRYRIIYAGFVGETAVAAMVWANPTSRSLPQDETWLELSRWCLTPAAGRNAGSRMHGRFVRWLRRNAPAVSTLVSYSDPSQGHTGALYRACNWYWAPTWHRLRPPPSGNGSWDGVNQQAVKDRWVFDVGPDPLRAEILRVKDDAIVNALRNSA
jgi:hypothetical protein